MGEELQCGTEIDNSHNPYAVSMQAADCGTCPSDLVQYFCGAMAQLHACTFSSCL